MKCVVLRQQESNLVMNVNEFVTLGRSGLRVSRLCLGTMTFGTEWGWGSAYESAAQIFRRFVDAGGNFIDTADAYTNGSSEEFLGRMIKEGGVRDKIVLATKFSFNTSAGDPNAGGNGRKNIMRAIEGSLRRLQTDYIDVYWLHDWDTVTPVEELMHTLNSLVEAGKVRYIGFSNSPAWYLGRAQTIAELRGYERICALQLEYSLLERNIEHEYVLAARELGMGICPWSPLASGLLTGRYTRAKNAAASGEGRLEQLQNSGNPAFLKLFTERNWKIIEAVVAVAKEVGKPAAQVALNWVANRPQVASVLIGATKLSQLDDNLAALDFTLPPEVNARLAEISRPETPYPYHFFEPTMQAMVTGGTELRKAA
jgi:aryl-alcohol dehydrogenase-like predicted oxidoreductase